MGKIAVTLANGKLGSQIIKLLVKKIGKENVIGIARSPEKAEYLGVEIRKGDYNSYSDFKLALKGIDTLLLISGIDEPILRAKQHENIIEASKENKVNKIVFTSVIGDLKNTSFKPIIESNRKTELDVSSSGMEWSIGRNSLYIEPDLEYINTYIKEGGIINSANDGKCGYTSRQELAKAYVEMALHKKHNGEIYNLLGKLVTQKELANSINKVYKTNLVYNSISVNDYLKDRKKDLGDFLGFIIGSIYENIRNGNFDMKSDFEKITGAPHLSLEQMILQHKEEENEI